MKNASSRVEDNECACCHEKAVGFDPRFGYYYCKTHENTPPVDVSALADRKRDIREDWVSLAGGQAMRVSVEGGKYTYVVTETNSHVLRYGELWRDATGDKFTYSMAAEIESLREQVEKLTEAYDQCGRTVQEYGKTIDQTESRLREVATHCANLEQQLAALAEQNEKFRETLSRWRYQNLSYNWCCGNCGAVDGDGHKEGCALSLPDLATVILNAKITGG